MAEIGKQPVDLVSDFLAQHWQQILKVLGSRIGDALVEATLIKVILTVPAIWDHQAQELMIIAAKNAGITKRSNTTLELVSEPEAAALATIRDNDILKVVLIRKAITAKTSANWRM